MATSFVKYNENGFWINDQLLIIVAHYIFLEYEKKNELDNWEKEFKEVIKDNADGYFVGFMNFKLDTFLVNRNRIDSFVIILNLTKKNIEKKGDYILANELNSMDVIEDVKIQWIENIESKRLIKIINYITDLINGNLTLSASDEINYSF